MWSRIKKPKRIALFDADDTLLVGYNPSTFVPVDYANIESIRATLPGVLNTPLMEALEEFRTSDGTLRIKEGYVFTDMTFKKASLNERKILVEELEKKGFKVLGVITPCDRAWHVDPKLLKAFYDEKIPLDEVDRASTERIEAIKNQIIQSANYQAIKKALEKGHAGKPGVAFKEASETSSRSEEAMRLRSTYCKIFLDAFYMVNGQEPKPEEKQEEPHGLRSPHAKCGMYQDFLSFMKEKQTNFTRCFLFEDNVNAIEGIRSMQGSPAIAEIAIPTTVVDVNNLTNSHRLSQRKNEADKTKKTAVDYRKEINTPLLPLELEAKEVDPIIIDLIAQEEEFKKLSKQEKLNTYMNRLRFHFTMYSSAEKKILETKKKAFINKIDELVALCKTPQEKINIYEHYLDSPVITTHRNSGLWAVGRTHTTEEMEAKIEKWQKESEALSTQRNI